MNTSKIIFIDTVILMIISLPFVFIHIMAAPDDAAISPLQHIMAALANYFGPWGVLLVRIVDFPNAGLRSFNWLLASGMTILGALLVYLTCNIKILAWQIVLSVIWGVFLIIWFGIGLLQIADGLL